MVFVLAWQQSGLYLQQTGTMSLLKANRLPEVISSVVAGTCLALQISTVLTIITKKRIKNTIFSALKAMINLAVILCIMPFAFVVCCHAVILCIYIYRICFYSYEESNNKLNEYLAVILLDHSLKKSNFLKFNVYMFVPLFSSFFQ